MKWTVDKLKDFETQICKDFADKKIRAPIHLHNGNEHQLINIFEEIREDDWVFSSWRSHYHCLLKGVPPEELRQAILSGRSIGLCFPEYKIYSSGIVTGQLSPALGVAMGIKRLNKKEKVHVFLGDMTRQSGQFHECHKYANNFSLPIRWIVEDNNVSVCTPTRKVWGLDHPFNCNKIEHYYYNNKYPHAGSGERIQF